MPELRAFHNEPEIKAKYLARVREHRRLDQITKGFYWKGGRGCAVGCTLHSGNHNAYEVELGVPEPIARLEDTLFEKMPLERSKSFPEEFLTVIPVGADLSLVAPRFLVWLMADLEQFAGGHEDVLTSLRTVGVLWQRVVGGEDVLRAEWDASYDDASAASHASHAASDAAAYAAYAAASDAAYAAAYAAYAASHAASDAASYAASYAERMADKLLELLAGPRVYEGRSTITMNLGLPLAAPELVAATSSGRSR